MKKLILFGIGIDAEIAHFYFTHDSDFEVVLFTVEKNYLSTETFCGLPVVPFEDIEKKYLSNEYHMFVAVGYSKMNHLREIIFKQAKLKGYCLPSYVSSKATIWPDLDVGENCFILEDNTIQPFVKIGNNVTLWSGNHIGHHSKIGNNCFISSHVVISGGVTIEDNCFIGVNSTIKDHIKIRYKTLISAGSWINKDTSEHGVYITKPAKLIPNKSTDIII